jgi:protein O-mannosyl-transferase
MPASQVSPAPVPPVAAWSRGQWRLAAGAIAVTALIAYSGSFHVPLLFDDIPAITNNPTIRHLSDWRQVLSPPASSGPSGRPLLNLSFALNYAVEGLRVPGYHLVNLALHILNGLLLFGIANRILTRWISRPDPAANRRGGGFAAGAGPLSSRLLALGIALLWTAHPLQTEAVTYLSERAEVLMATFYLLTLYAFLRAADAPAYGFRWLLLSVASCWLGMAAKEVTVTAPVLVFLCDSIFVAGKPSAAWRARWRYYAGLGGSWAFLAWIMLTRSKHSIGFAEGVGVWEYALTECQAVVHYLELAIWPHPLVFDYGPVLASGLAKVLPEAIALLCLLIGAAALLWRAPAGGFLGAWFFILLAPTSSVVPVALQPIAESRTYLPLAAVVAAIVLGAHRLLGARARWFLLAAVLGAVAGTMLRNHDYRDELSIWGDTAAKRPHSPRAQANYGDALAHAGRLDEAIEHFRLALQLTPGIAQIRFELAKALHDRELQQSAGGPNSDDGQSHYRRGMDLFRRSQFEDSVREFQQALQLNPKMAEVRDALGTALFRLGRSAEAIQEYEAVLAANPDYAPTYNNLGNVLFQANRVDEAKQQFEQALRLKPDYAQAHTSLGDAELQLGNVDQAKGHFEAALRLDPSDAEAHFRIGNLLAMGGRLPEAMTEWQASLRWRPDDVEAHNNLGMALAQSGRIPDAIQQFKEALRLQPNYERARENLADLQGQVK